MKLKIYILAFLTSSFLFANIKTEFNPPNYSISYPTPGCIIAGNIIQVNYADNTGGGIPFGLFSSTAGLIIDAETGAVNAGTSLPGNYLIKYQTSPTSFVSTNLVLKNSILPNFTIFSTVCQNSVPATLPTTSNNGVTGTWFPAVINTSSLGILTYTFTPTFGQCGQQYILTINVNTPTIIPTFNIATSYCKNAILANLPTTSLNGISGGWSSTSINTATTGQSTYVFTGIGICIAPVNLVVTIIEPTVPSFSNINILNNFQSIPVLNQISPNGILGTWTPATINATQSGNYTFTPNEGQCAVAKTINVAVLYPTATVPPVLQTCDNGNGFGTFNLADNNSFINPNANNVTLIDYYLTLAQAQSIFPQISLNASSYINTVAFNQTVYAKVVDLSNALRPFSVVAVQLKVNPTLQPVATCASNFLNIYVDEFNVLIQNLTLSTIFQGNVIYRWYEADVPISGFSSSYTINNYNGLNPRIFKVKVTKPIVATCEGFSNNITVGTIRVGAPIGSGTQYYSAGQTLANLVVSGSNIRWYSSYIGVPASLLPIGTLLTNNTIYYASQTIDGVESRNIKAVTTILNLANDSFTILDLKFSPNPVLDFLNIQSQEIIKNISITNVVGQEVYNQKCNNLDLKLDLSTLNTGNYIIKIESDNKKMISKILKN